MSSKLTIKMQWCAINWIEEIRAEVCLDWAFDINLSTDTAKTQENLAGIYN